MRRRRRKGRRRRRRRRKKKKKKEQQQPLPPRQKRKQKPPEGSEPAARHPRGCAARPWPGRTGTAAAPGRSRRRTSRRSSSSRRRWGRRWRDWAAGPVAGAVPSRGDARALRGWVRVSARGFAHPRPAHPPERPGNTEENRINCGAGAGLASPLALPPCPPKKR